MAEAASPRRPRILRAAVIGLAGLVVLVIVGVAVTVLSFDPNRYKSEIVAAVQRATGRQLTLNGSIGMKLSLQPTLAMDDVELANPPGFSRAQMATLRRVEVQLSVWPLLHHRLEISRLVLIQPDLLLETDAGGHNNWQFSPASSAATPPPPPRSEAQSGSSTGAASGADMTVSVQNVRIEGGTVGWRDAKSGLAGALAIKQFEAKEASPDAPIDVTMDASYRNGPFSLIGNFGPASRLRDTTSSDPWPIKLAISASGADVAVNGSLARPLQGSGIAVTIDAKVPDLATLSAFTGQPLPPLKSITFSAKLGEPSDGVPGLVLTDLHLALPQADLSGQMTVSLTSPPMVRATFVSNRIDADALGAIRPAPPAAAPPTAAPATAAPQAPASPAAAAAPPAGVNRISDTKLPFPLLRLADADVTVKVGELKATDGSYRNIAGHAVIRGGQLTLDPFGIDLPAGHLDGKLTANANATPPTVAATLRAPALNVQILLARAGHSGPASGNVDVNAVVNGVGETPRQLVATLSGPIGVALVNGQIDNRLLGESLAFLLQKVQLLDLFKRGGDSDLRCFALRIDATRGTGNVSALLLNSSLLTMDGDGSVNFGNETLALRLRPEARVAGTSVVVPMLVTGSFDDPIVNTDPAGLITSNAGTAASLALGFATLGAAPAAGALLGKDIFGASDSCARPVALARLQAVAPAGAAPPAPGQQPQQQKQKPPNPADLLRQLFR